MPANGSMFMAIEVVNAQLPDWAEPWLPVVVFVLLVPVAKFALAVLRRAWLAGAEKVPFDRPRARQRIETVIAFIRSVVYFTLVFLALMYSLKALFPGFDPATATGALSIVALVLTGMFRDVVVDVVKGLDILFGGHYGVGDYIRVGNFAGHVVDFQLKYTKLRTASGEEIVINNAACIPSRRFPEGTVENYVDVPLANKADEARAKERLEAVATTLVSQVEAVQERPRLKESFPLPGGDGLVLRYAVKVLPGANWAIQDYYIPLIHRALEQAEIPLTGDATFFFMNDVSLFRTLFNRRGDSEPTKPKGVGKRP